MLNKKIYFFLILSYNLNAQVGISTTDPQSTLDITASSSSAPSSTDGVLIPRMDSFPATNPTAPQNSMLVYLTTDLTNVNISGTSKDYDEGFYSWDNSLTDWIRITSKSGWEIDGNDNTTNGTHFIGTTNTEEVDFRVNDQLRFTMTEKGQLETFAEGGSIYIGRKAGENDDGSVSHHNIFIGERAAEENTSGYDNVVVGGESLTFNKTGYQNAAFGWSALWQSTGNNNVGIGNNAGKRLTGGFSNVFIGSFADLSADGSTEGSTIVGGDAKIVNADDVTGLGYATSVEADRGTALGYSAKVTGESAIAIGENAEANGINSVAIGRDAVASSNNQIVLGDAFITEVETSGVMKAESFLATGTGTTYPDYVFEKYYNGYSKINSDYKFASLDKAEVFVKKNGHLPGVMSYKELKDKYFVLDVTSTAVKNLEKIEEQFLYITELSKAIKMLNEIVEKQESAMEKQESTIKTLNKRLKRLEKK